MFKGIPWTGLQRLKACPFGLTLGKLGSSSFVTKFGKNNSVASRPAGLQYLSVKDLAVRFGVSQPTIWYWTKIGSCGFPKPIKLGAQITRWRLIDIETWEAERDAASRSEVA